MLLLSLSPFANCEHGNLIARDLRLELYRSPDYTVIIKLRRVEGKELIFKKKKKRRQPNPQKSNP